MSQQIYMNRELSWLKFNERVLEEAENKKVPLCERLTFASIYQSNLDEFFRVRVGSLVDQMLLGGKIRDNKTKMTAKEQIEAVLHQVMKLNRRKDAVYDAIMGQLEDYGIRLVDFRKISKKESEYLEKYFLNEIAPVISPTIVGKRQPFPFLKNNEIYAVVVLQTKSGKEKLGIIPCSNTGFKRLVELPTAGTYMLAEELILHYIPEVFERYNIKAKSLQANMEIAKVLEQHLVDGEMSLLTLSLLVHHANQIAKPIFLLVFLLIGILETVYILTADTRQ